MIKLKLFSAVS